MEEVSANLGEVQEEKTTRSFVLKNPVVAKLQKRVEKYSNIIPELLQQYREIKVGSVPKDRVLRIFYPTPRDESEANKAQSKAWGRLIKDEELKTEAEIMKSIKARGIWSDEDESKFRGVQKRLSRLSSEISKQIDNENVTEKQLTKLTDDYEKTEIDLDRMLDIRSSYLGNSLENRVSEVRLKELMWRCVKEVKKKEDSEEVDLLPVWSSYEELESEKDRMLIISITNECMTFWQGVPADFLDDWREALNGEKDTQ